MAFGNILPFYLFRYCQRFLSRLGFFHARGNDVLKKRKPGRPPLPKEKKVVAFYVSFLPDEAVVLRKIGSGDERTGVYRIVLGKLKEKGMKS